MKQVVVCGVKPKSENEIRAMSKRAWIASYTKSLRRKTSRVLALLNRPSVGPYVVTMTRLSAGVLDQEGVVGAFKPVQDEIASWIGIVDDSHPIYTWRFEQGPCRLGEGGMIIAIEDGHEGIDRELRTRDAPTIKSELVTKQMRLPLRPCHIRLPWDQVPGEKKPRDTRLKVFEQDPPARFNVSVPTRATKTSWAARIGEPVEFVRTEAVLGGTRVYLYRVEG